MRGTKLGKGLRFVGVFAGMQHWVQVIVIVVVVAVVGKELWVQVLVAVAGTGQLVGRAGKDQIVELVCRE
jgi:hypothetical protein